MSYIVKAVSENKSGTAFAYLYLMTFLQIKQILNEGMLPKITVKLFLAFLYYLNLNKNCEKSTFFKTYKAHL